jgi:cell division protein FtsW (lipid II flippase)
MRGSGLLLLGLICGTLAQVLVHLAGDTLDTRAYTAMAFYVCSFIFLYFWTGRKGDIVLLPALAVLMGLGIAEIWRIDPELGWQQAQWVVLGTVVFAVASRFRNWHMIADLKYVWAFAGAILLVLTLIFGREVGGAKAWIRIGKASFQASEIVKLLVVASLAGHLAESKEFLAAPRKRLGFLRIPSTRHFGPLLVMWLLFMFMFVVQRDLGGALLLFGVFVTMVYVASGRWLYLGIGTLMVSVGGLLAYSFFDHVRNRFVVWINPWPYFQNRGYQIVQALFSVAAGGVLGTGLGLGSPQLVPASVNDFIFVALVEELGLIGGISIISLYMVLVVRGLKYASLHGDSVQSLVGVGLSVLLGVQTLLILGGVTRLIPVTGVTLPFLSYGGSSLLTSFAQLGLMYNLSASVPVGQVTPFKSSAEVSAWK